VLLDELELAAVILEGIVEVVIKRPKIQVKLVVNHAFLHFSPQSSISSLNSGE